MDSNRFLSRRLISVFAATPEPGWTYVNYSLFYNAEVDRTVGEPRRA